VRRQNRIQRGCFKLRDAVLSQTAARIVVLDLSEVDVRGGGGFGNARIPAAMGLCTRSSAEAVQSLPIRTGQREYAGSIPAFEIPTLDEMIALLARADRRYALASKISNLRSKPCASECIGKTRNG
jgi:hypothetical protein